MCFITFYIINYEKNMNVKSIYLLIINKQIGIILIKVKANKTNKIYQKY